jgi:hypothetical protein
MCISYSCYISLSIEKGVWNLYYKNCPVIWQYEYFVSSYTDFNSCSKSKDGGFQNNYHSPYLYCNMRHSSWTWEAERPHEILAHLICSLKADSCDVYLCDKRTLRGAVVNVVDVLPSRRGGVVCLLLLSTTNHIVAGVKYLYRNYRLFNFHPV